VFRIKNFAWHAGMAVGLVLATGPVLLTGKAPVDKTGAVPTFYKDVLPILQQHCQACHRPGEIAPTSFVTYEQTKPFAKPIAARTRSHNMPPWFADPRYGHFSNDPSLNQADIQTLSAWADAGAPAGNAHDAPPPPHWTEGWNIPNPDLVLQLPRAVAIPSRGVVEYTYEIVPTGFKQGQWIQSSELRPTSRDHVHHAVVYIRPPDSMWLRGAPVGQPFTASSLADPKLQHEAHSTDSDLLLAYAPGSSPDQWPDGLAKFIPAGSDLVFQMHYTTNGRAGSDQTRLGLVFAKDPVKQRVLTLQLNGGGGPPHPPRAANN
jgi:hypothetical protein